MSYDALDDTAIMVRREEGSALSYPTELRWIKSCELVHQPPAIESVVRSALARSDRWFYDDETDTWHNLEDPTP